MNLSFTIEKPNGKVVTITGETDGTHIYRGGVIVRCSCNKQNPVPYLFDGENVYCPSCYNTSLNVSIIDDDNDLYLYYIGLDYNTMQDLFKLNATLPYREWLKVSEYFVKLKPSDVDLDYSLDYIGWVTSTPQLVETALDIPFEKWIVNRDVEKELEEYIEKQEKNQNILSDEDKTYYFDIVDKLHEVFSVHETPYGQFDLSDGIVIPNPLFPPNEYGSGEYWVLMEDDNEVWYVRNNYRDGDDLKFNNILVDGELKAIGKVIAYDGDVDKLLQELAKKVN